MQTAKAGTNKLRADILKTKRHLEIPDGLRGIAALSAIIFHFMEMAINDYSKNFIGHGFLAVDFFFCSSSLPQSFLFLLGQ